jgi:hypothetical protein
LEALVAAAEADPVIRIDDDQRLVPEADCFQAVDEAPEQRVGVAHLQQVPLPVLVDGGLVAVPNLV